ncbi:MAG: hypothetical protein MI725_03840 [Pirellulales bacterium]|nr:hypothetical protein [Pirellulales bacterium]
MSSYLIDIGFSQAILYKYVPYLPDLVGFRFRALWLNVNYLLYRVSSEDVMATFDPFFKAHTYEELAQGRKFNISI